MHAFCSDKEMCKRLVLNTWTNNTFTKSRDKQSGHKLATLVSYVLIVKGKGRTLYINLAWKHAFMANRNKKESSSLIYCVYLRWVMKCIVSISLNKEEQKTNLCLRGVWRHREWPQKFPEWRHIHHSLLNHSPALKQNIGNATETRKFKSSI